MRTTQKIMLTIPEPCSERWEEMTPAAQGRFCAYCQKTVIDFSGWSDTALYRFFEQHSGPVCGRLQTTQLNRSIQLPPQKSTLLYRIALAMGLTLVMAHTTTEVKARPRPPLVEYSFSDQDTVAKSDDSSIWVFRGVILDERGDPFEGVTVIVSEGGIVKGGAVTDKDGNYVVRIDRVFSHKENLELQIWETGYKRHKINGSDHGEWQQISLKRDPGFNLFLTGALIGPPPRYLDKTDIIKPKRYGY